MPLGFGHVIFYESLPCDGMYTMASGAFYSFKWLFRPAAE